MQVPIRDTLSLLNLQRDDIRANPYPYYDQLRVQDPVHWDEELGFWVFTRYTDIDSLYTDERFSRAQGLMRGFERLSPGEQKIAEPVYHSFAKTVFYADPPYHTHLRGLMNHAFTPRRVEQLRPRVQKIVDELLDIVQAQSQPDIIRGLAYPLPVMVIAELLGLPTADRARFKRWSDDLFAILGTVRRKPPELIARAAESLREMTDYVKRLSRKRRAAPQDDLLTALLSFTEGSEPCPHAEGAGKVSSAGRSGQEAVPAHRLTEDELVANINILLSTGHETTTHLIGNGLFALLQHPDQLRKLRSQPALLGRAIEEMLRYDSPVQITYRSTREDAYIGGKLIRKGDLVNTILGSANRDPERFSDPDRFDITRNEGRHLGFGIGIHFCIGAPLVRLEAEIVFETILRRFPGMQLASDRLEWQEHPIFRGLKSLPVRW
ncbi:MAG TPA: cytochrome P450 [Anaerolineales bacterium]|nr:cytochrome P450 [Anaerolineales bacterium]